MAMDEVDEFGTADGADTERRFGGEGPSRPLTVSLSLFKRQPGPTLTTPLATARTQLR